MNAFKQKFIIAGGALALFCSAAMAMTPEEFRAEVAVADSNYVTAMQTCQSLYGEQQARCAERARITRQNAVETARVQTETVAIVRLRPLPGTTPADRSDAVVAAEQKRMSLP